MRRNQAALVVKISDRFKFNARFLRGRSTGDARSATTSLSDHQADAALLEVAKTGIASLVALSIEVQNDRKK